MVCTTLTERGPVQDYIFLSVGRVGSSTELIKQEVLRVDMSEKQLILLDLLSTVQETMNGGVQDPKKVHTSFTVHPSCIPATPEPPLLSIEHCKVQQCWFVRECLWCTEGVKGVDPGVCGDQALRRQPGGVPAREQLPCDVHPRRPLAVRARGCVEVFPQRPHPHPGGHRCRRARPRYPPRHTRHQLRSPH